MASLVPDKPAVTQHLTNVFSAVGPIDRYMMTLIHFSLSESFDFLGTPVTYQLSDINPQVSAAMSRAKTDIVRWIFSVEVRESIHRGLFRNYASTAKGFGDTAAKHGDHAAGDPVGGNSEPGTAAGGEVRVRIPDIDRPDRGQQHGQCERDL
jgi:hypothetical protein